MPRTTPLDRIRNIGIMAHIDAGKTTTTERILYYTGRTYKLGEVHDGTATMDWMEQEQERVITMDRVGADFERCVAMVQDRLGAKPVVIQLPLGSGELFTGIVDLVRQIEIVYDDETLGKKYVEGPIPAALLDRVKEMRHLMLEAVVEHDDAILHKYLEGQPLSEAEIRTVLRKATLAGHVVPVICGAAFKNKGVQALLDAVVDFLPAPVDVAAIKGHLPHHDATHAERHASDEEPFAALAFKIATDPYVGKLTFFRVYSGVLGAGSYIYNSTKDRRERIGRLLQMHANKREEIEEVRAGEIAAAIGLKATKTGNPLAGKSTRSSSRP